MMKEDTHSAVPAHQLGTCPSRTHLTAVLSGRLERVASCSAHTVSSLLCCTETQAVTYLAAATDRARVSAAASRASIRLFPVS